MLFSVHYAEVVYVSSVTSDVAMVINRGGGFRCSFNLSPNVLAVSPMYSSSHSNLSHLYLYIIPLLLVKWSLSFGDKGEADEIRVEVKKALKRAQCTPRPPPNISKKEFQALKELKEDKGRVILTPDKGVSLVIMDRTEYKKKVEELLNTRTYKKISEDPTKKRKKKQVNQHPKEHQG